MSTSTENIKKVVKERYGQAALRVTTGGSSCCGAASALRERLSTPSPRTSTTRQRRVGFLTRQFLRPLAAEIQPPSRSSTPETSFSTLARVAALTSFFLRSVLAPQGKRTASI